MTGFLAALAARAVGTPPALRPRTVYRFEPGRELTGTRQQAPLTDTEHLVDAPVPAADGASADSGASSEQRGTPPAPTRVPIEHPENALRRTIREATATARPAPPPEQQPPGAAGDVRRPPTTDDSHSVDVVPARAETRPAIAPRPQASPPRDAEPERQPADGARPVAPSAVPDSRVSSPDGDEAPGLRPRVLARVRDRPVVEDIDVAAILREEVFQALVTDRAVPATERPVVAQPGRLPRQPPAPGTARLRASNVAIDPLPADGAEATAERRVQVHIGKVSVTRAPPPATPPPAPSAPPLVDHAAYLDRRRGHR